MSRPAFVFFLALALAGASAHGSPGDDDGEAAPPPSHTSSRTASKPVPFERAWLEPFFQKGPAKQAVERFRAEDWSGAEAGFAKALKSLRGDEKLAATDMLALSRVNDGDWAGAGRLFEELYTSYPRLAPYHAYNAARCRLRRGDWAGALAWADKVAAGSVPEAETALVRIDALRSLSRWDDALAALKEYLTRYPNGPRRAEALFKKAEAMEKTSPPAPSSEVVAIYRRVWADAPLEAWSERASDRLEQIAAGLPAPEAAVVRGRTAAEMVTRGMVFFDHNRNQESETTLAGALGATGLNPDLECKARFYRAQSVWKARQRPRAAPLFDEADWACAKAGNRDLHAKALYQGARSWASAGNRDVALAHYQRVETEHADHSYADDARIRMAELLTDAGDEGGAAKTLAEVPVRYPQGDLLNEALWRLAFGEWRAGHLDEAMHWLDENLRLVPHEEIWYAEGRVQYWKGRVFDKQGHHKEARDWYERAIKEYPLSVYALLSFARLRAADRRATDALVASLRKGFKDVPAWSFPPRALYAEPGFLRAVELARMGQGGDARRELAKLGLATSADKHASAAASAAAQAEGEDVIWITATLLDRGGVWSASHSLPRFGVTNYRLEWPKGLNTAKWKLAYPRAFAALVTKNAKANGQPEALQLAIMREESAFSPRTESFANAIGLTQMLVKTARRFADGPVTRDTLMDPAKNLELGARFLGFLWKRFDGAAPLSIAGYNAGEAAVDRWLADRGDLDMDEFVETIPYDETRNYTKRVLASYFAYSWLYADKPVPAIPLRAKVTPQKPEHAKREGHGDASKG